MKGHCSNRHATEVTGAGRPDRSDRGRGGRVETAGAEVIGWEERTEGSGLEEGADGSGWEERA